MWVVGVIIVLTSCAITTVGLILSKLSHVIEDYKAEHERLQICCRPIMWSGLFVAVVITAPMDVFALLFMRYSLMAPFASEYSCGQTN